MKKITLTNMQRDVLLFKALLRKVFPLPQRGQMYFSTIDLAKFDEPRLLYLDIEYFEILNGAILEAHIEGKFQNSNAFSEWKGLMKSFENAIEVSNVNFDNLKEWEI